MVREQPSTVAVDAQIKSLIGTSPPSILKMIDRWGKNNPQKDPQISFSGKAVLVTGSNTGLRYQAALKFAALGASKLIPIVHISAKGEEAKIKIVQATACNPTTIIVIKLENELDMYLMKGLIDDYFKNAKGEIDIAINVAYPS